MPEKRRANRTSVVRSISYSDNRYAPHEMIPSTTKDVSAGGVSLYTSRSFGYGETMTVSSPLFGKMLRNARVCWSRPLTGGVYQVGLSFN